MFGTFLCAVTALPDKIQQNPSLKTVNTPVNVHGRTPEVARIVFKLLRIQIMQVNTGEPVHSFSLGSISRQHIAPVTLAVYIPSCTH